MSASDTFVITSALLFGPAPATVALAVLGVAMSWRRGHGWTRLAFNAAAPALSLWVAARVFFLIVHAPPLSAGLRVGRRVHRALVLADHCLLRPEYRFDVDRHRARVEAVARRRLAPAFSLALAFVPGGRVGRLLPDPPDSADEPRRRGGDPPGRRGLLSDVACVLRTRRGRQPACDAGEPLVPVHGRNAGDGDRRQRRRDAQPRAFGCRRTRSAWRVRSGSPTSSS